MLSVAAFLFLIIFAFCLLLFAFCLLPPLLSRRRAFAAFDGGEAVLALLPARKLDRLPAHHLGLLALECALAVLEAAQLATIMPSAGAAAAAILPEWPILQTTDAKIPLSPF